MSEQHVGTDEPEIDDSKFTEQDGTAPTAWFINEEGGVYQYEAAAQVEDFPNDLHVPYATEADAEAAVEAIEHLEVNAYAIPVTDVDVSFSTGVSEGDGPMSLGEAANKAAINLIRVGLDGYRILYTDRPTGRQWISENGVFVEVPGGSAD